MSGSQQLLLAAVQQAVATDEYFEYTTLLLPGNGTNGAQNNTFLDSSTNAFSITRNGNTTQGTFSPFSQTGWGVYFNGSSDYISVADSADFTMGSGDFTIQCWVYSTANSGSDQYILGQVPSTGAAASTSFQLYKKATTNVAECYVYIGGSKVATSTATIPVGQWTHLAMVRDGGTMRLYVNGSQDGTNATLSTSSIVDSTGSFSVGRTGDYNGLYFAGYVSNVSVVKGTCLFPNGTTFTPSTTPLSTSTSGQSVLLCQANRFIDTNTATTAKTVTVGSTSSIQAFSPFNPTAAWSAATNGGSGYFDGSGDYLNGPSTGQFAPTGDFTISMWIYPTSFAASFYVLAGSWNAGAANEWLIQYDNTGAIRFLTTTDSTFSAAGVIKLNQWQFLSISRTGSTLTGYVNGTSFRSYTLTGTVGSATKVVYIGAQQGTTWPYIGYMADFRMVAGSAESATPPTAPATAISGTNMLLNFTNAGIYDATSKNDLETVGNAQISTTQSKFGGSSMYFDGTSDALYIPANPDFAFGTGDFTVECWIYTSETTADTFYRRIYMTDGPTGNASGNFQIALVPTTGYANLWDGTLDLIGTSNVCNGAWHHIAATRFNSTLRLFVDGIQQGSTTYSVSVSPNSGKPRPYVGTYNGTSGDFNGYIQDLRITKGIARYTSNFTPPTTAFQLL